MLLFCFVLFLISAVNGLGDPGLLSILWLLFPLLLILPTILGSRIYKMWSLGLLETSCILNLILAMATLYIHTRGGNQNAATFSLVGITFATFIGIIIYHSIQQVKGTRWLRKIFSKLLLSPKTPCGHPGEKTSELDYEDLADGPVTAPTMSLIDLSELNLYMLREPCMESNQ